MYAYLMATNSVRGRRLNAAANGEIDPETVSPSSPPLCRGIAQTDGATIYRSSAQAEADLNMICAVANEDGSSSSTSSKPFPAKASRHEASHARGQVTHLICYVTQTSTTPGGPYRGSARYRAFLLSTGLFRLIPH